MWAASSTQDGPWTRRLEVALVVLASTAIATAVAAVALLVGAADLLWSGPLAAGLVAHRALRRGGRIAHPGRVAVAIGLALAVAFYLIALTLALAALSSLPDEWGAHPEEPPGAVAAASARPRAPGPTAATRTAYRRRAR